MTTTFENERRSRSDFFWVVPLGGLFIIIGLTLSQYPDIFHLIGNYLRVLSETGKVSRPPLRLGEAVVFFFLVAGGWGLFSAALRFVFAHPPVKAVGDIMGSFFAFFIAYIVFQYDQGAIRAASLLPLLIVALGIVIVVNAIASHAHVTRSRLVSRESNR